MNEDDKGAESESKKGFRQSHEQHRQTKKGNLQKLEIHYEIASLT